MSSPTVKRSVVWLDLEKKEARRTSSRSTHSQTPASPLPWIDLASVAGSNEESDRGTIMSFGTTDFSAETISVYTPQTGWEFAAGYEKGAYAFSHHAGSGIFPASGKAQSVVSTESNIEYPNGWRLTLIFILLSLSMFLVGLDRTIVSTAIPTISNDFKALSDVGWYGSAYLITTTVLQPTWGKLYVIFNLKRVFMSIMIVFVFGSLICAVAPNSTVFIIGRALAGLGAGGLYAGAITILAHSVPLHRRPAFTGGVTAVFGIASFVGPLLGGVFTDKIGWRWCFWINLPLGAVSIVGIALCLHNPKGPESNKPFKEKLQEVDYIGPLIFIPGIISLLLALQWGGAVYAWNSPTIIGLLCAFAVIMPVWVYSQIRLGEKATIPLRLIRQRTLLFSSIYSFCFASFTILSFYLPLYFQAVKDSGATESGIQTLPMILSVTLAAIIGGFLISLVGYVPPFMIIGTAIASVGVGLLTTLGVDTPIGKWLGFQIIVGIGVGLNLQSPLIAVQTVVRLKDVPVATSVCLFWQILGSSIFIALAQAVLLAKLLPKLLALNPDLTRAQVIQAGALGLKTLVRPDQLSAILSAYAKGVDSVFIVTTVLTVVGTLSALPIEWKNLKNNKIKAPEGFVGINSNLTFDIPTLSKTLQQLNLASSNSHQDDETSRPPHSILERRRSSLVALAKKINLFGSSSSTTDIVDNKDPEHARFKPLDTVPIADESMDTTSPSSTTSETAPKEGSTRSSGASTHNSSGRERPHPPPLDTAAANNLPRDKLNSSLPSDAVTPTPPPDTSNANNNARKPRTGTNAAGHSSPLAATTFSVGVSEDVNKKCRRTMEDTHSYVYDFHVSGSDSGYFAIFDGHAGKSAAEFCGKNFHHILSNQLELAESGVGVPEILDRTFVEVDNELDRLSSGNNRTSGCTAVVAYTRWEDRNVPDRSALKKEQRKSGDVEGGAEQARPTKVERRRVLYTGNVGDARIVLCRRGKAVRLSYDHKGTDEAEGRRIAAAGGLILNSRVNGVLAVTRALGDTYMKEYISGHPFTTETILSNNSDEFMILACDGLWDVCQDQHAVNLIRKIHSPEEAAETLVRYALEHFSTDNVSVMVVRFSKPAQSPQHDSSSSPPTLSESPKE